LTKYLADENAQLANLCSQHVIFVCGRTMLLETLSYRVEFKVHCLCSDAVLDLFCSLTRISLRLGTSPGCECRRRPQIREAAANILNKQSRTVDKGWVISSRVGRMRCKSSL